MANYPSADYFKDFLLSIYHCKVPFELMVIDKKPKTRSGVYIVDKRRIRIYAQWGVAIPLKEIAIHEYAHHIHDTEQNGERERPHGPQFWEIYGALMCRAAQKGLFKEKRVYDIAKEEKIMKKVISCAALWHRYSFSLQRKLKTVIYDY